MLYLLMAIASNTAIVFVMKFSENHQGNRYAATVVNYIAGVIITYLLMKEKTLFYNTPEGWFAMGLAVFNAICMTSCMLLNQYSIGKNGAPMSTTFNRLGVLIPTVLSMILFHELPTVLQMGGLVLAIAAIVYINGGKGESNHIGSLPTLLLVFVIGGLIDFNSKLYGAFGQVEIQDYYVFYSFVFNTLISLGIMLKMDRSMKKQDVINGVLMGIPNQMITYSMVRAVLFLPAYLAFPLYSAGVILCVNVINFAVFREKLTRREMVATIIIAIALILLNI